MNSHILPEHDVRPYSIAQLADRWGCSDSVVRKLISQGELQCFRIGILIRVPAAEVARYEASAAHCNEPVTATPHLETDASPPPPARKTVDAAFSKRVMESGKRRRAPISRRRPRSDD